MSDATTTVDYVKLACALVGLAQDDLGALDSGRDSPSLAIETALARLEHVRHVLRHVVGVCCAHCAEDMEHYADGRPVTSHLRFCDGTQFVHHWHPDPAHPLNRPHEIAAVTTRNGTRKRVIVTAPGHLDAISSFPGCDRPPRVLGGDDW
jgi:hypothetical protein